MSLTDYAWLALAAYAVHILEEHTFDWRNWARAVIGLPVEWSDFYVTNAVVVVLGIVTGRTVRQHDRRSAVIRGADADQRHLFSRAALH